MTQKIEIPHSYKPDDGISSDNRTAHLPPVEHRRDESVWSTVSLEIPKVDVAGFPDQ